VSTEQCKLIKKTQSLKLKSLNKRKEENELKIKQQQQQQQDSLNDLMLLTVLNRFVFILFFIYIILLNVVCLFVLPFYVKEPLSLDDYE
jgi:hypothetical protein